MIFVAETLKKIPAMTLLVAVSIVAGLPVRANWPAGQPVERPVDPAVDQRTASGNVDEALPTEPSGDETVTPPSPPARPATTLAFRSLHQLATLIETGLPELALSLLEREQEKRPVFSAEWYAFEYKRADILGAGQHWRQLDQRIDWLLATARPGRQITRKIRLWFETRQIIARLRLDQGEQALQQLRRLIWTQAPEAIDASLPSIWRRLVIRAYVSLGLDEDAQRSMVKYNQDFPDAEEDTEWRLLQVRILLSTGRPGEAGSILAGMQTPPNTAQDERREVLHRLAQLAWSRQPATEKVRRQRLEKLLAELRPLAEKPSLSPSRQSLYAYVSYQVWRTLGDESQQIRYLQQLLAAPGRYDGDGLFEAVQADELWRLYEKRGLAIANEYKLLIGDDMAWQTLAGTHALNQSAAGLYLNAALAFNSRQKTVRQGAFDQVFQRLKKREGDLSLSARLFLDSDRIADLTVLSVQHRYALVDHALAHGQLAHAARLMDSLEEPPPGETAFDWLIRKARVLLMQGAYQRSQALLQRSLVVSETLPQHDLDRFIQVVFDFQTLQQHERALQLFDHIPESVMTPQLRREIAFWRAESSFALQQYDRAALFYLQSATALDDENDLWGQSARFKAAEALVKAGLYSDADKVYRKLLAITVNDARRAQIRQNRQQIKLLKSVE